MKRRIASICLTTLMVIISAGIASGCCQENWTAEKRDSHSGCTAGPIDAGVPSYAGSTLYRHHNAPYTKPDDSDVDCHRKTDCSYNDESETQFTCDWKIQVYSGGQWQDCEYQAISGDCTGANWDTTGYKPGLEYRAKSFTNDTSGDGPYGDDAGVYHYSGSVQLKAPEVTHYTKRAGWPQCDINGLTLAFKDGALAYRYDWDCSCCKDLEHLDKVTIRENVTYDGYTSGTPPMHDSSHDGSNCFTNQIEDPTLRGKVATSGWWSDTHEMLGVFGVWASYCQGSQLYQWASGWPEAPPVNGGDEFGWTTIEEHTIRRYVEEYQSGHWRYRIMKDNDGCTHNYN